MARLQVRLSRSRLRRNELGVGDAEHHPVDVGKLPALPVHPVVEGIALEHVSLRGRPGGVDPGLEGGKLGVGVLVGAEAVDVHGPPVAPPLRLRELLELRRVGVTDVESLEVVGGREYRLGPRTGEGGKEEGVGVVPGVSDRVFVEHLEVRGAPLHPQHVRGAEGREALVAGDVLPEVAEVLRAQRVPVRPPQPRAQAQGEDAPLLDLVGLEQIRNQPEVPVVGDQARVAVDHQHAHILLPAREHSELAAVTAEFPPVVAEIDDARPLRQALGDGRQHPCRHRVTKVGCLDVLGGGGSERERPEQRSRNTEDEAPHGRHQEREPCLSTKRGHDPPLGIRSPTRREIGGWTPTRMRIPVTSCFPGDSGPSRRAGIQFGT